MENKDNSKQEIHTVFNEAAVSILQLLIESGVQLSTGEADSMKASVKFMLTTQDETGLRNLGYSQEQIDKMKPQEAADILERGISTE